MKTGRVHVRRVSAIATAIIGVRHGMSGTRNRAGALEPPHHMYIRAELPVKRRRREQDEAAITQIRRRSMVQQPTIAAR